MSVFVDVPRRESRRLLMKAKSRRFETKFALVSSSTSITLNVLLVGQNGENRRSSCRVPVPRSPPFLARPPSSLAERRALPEPSPRRLVPDARRAPRRLTPRDRPKGHPQTAFAAPRARSLPHLGAQPPTGVPALVRLDPTATRLGKVLPSARHGRRLRLGGPGRLGGGTRREGDGVARGGRF